MPFDIETCSFLVWGYKNAYTTHTHIHEAFYRTLKHMGKDVLWLDQADPFPDNIENVFVITNAYCLTDKDYHINKPKLSSLPIRDDFFYAIHSLAFFPEIYSLFVGQKVLGWDVYKMNEMREKIGLSFYRTYDRPFKTIAILWATDLLPDEIEANKPTKLLHLKNKVINWVGTIWWMNEAEIDNFKKACARDNCGFVHQGGGQNGGSVVSIEENIKLIRESYMAPAITGTFQWKEGYMPCRIFKNISYGQFGVTNSPYINELFENKLIYNPHSYQLYYDAKEKLQDVTLEQLHSLMDCVKDNHTYVNRLETLLEAAKSTL